MTRQEKAERRNIIAKLYSDGVSADILAEQFGVGKNYIYTFAGKGRDPSSVSINILRENSFRVKALLETEMSYTEVGRRFGVSKEVVREFCKENNICRGANKNSEEDVAQKIRDKSDGILEYVSGYTIKENPVRVRCNVCGGEFERTYHNITTKGRVTCPCCTESERKRKADEKKTEMVLKRQAKELRIKERQAEEERKKAERIHKCPVCGTETNRPKYCCPDCAKKSSNKQRDHRRRMKITARLIDNDITVEGLYRRDSGVCYLCGGRCNLEDYTVRDGAFVAGDWYPSIDHVVPLAKGGEHSWNNVRLAHRRCNILKSDKII